MNVSKEIDRQMIVTQTYIIIEKTELIKVVISKNVNIVHVWTSMERIDISSTFPVGICNNDVSKSMRRHCQNDIYRRRCDVKTSRRC